MKVNRDFEINGAKFHLNDGKGIFCKSKYILMYYIEDFGWVEITGSVNNKKEALNLHIKRLQGSSQNIQAEKEWYAGLSRCEGYDVGRMGGNEKELAMDQNNI